MTFDICSMKTMKFLTSSRSDSTRYHRCRRRPYWWWWFIISIKMSFIWRIHQSRLYQNTVEFIHEVDAHSRCFWSGWWNAGQCMTMTMNTDMNMLFTMAMATITTMNTSKERFHFVISGQFCDVISSFYFISRWLWQQQQVSFSDECSLWLSSSSTLPTGLATSTFFDPWSLILDRHRIYVYNYLGCEIAHVTHH